MYARRADQPRDLEHAALPAPGVQHHFDLGARSRPRARARPARTTGRRRRAAASAPGPSRVPSRSTYRQRIAAATVAARRHTRMLTAPRHQRETEPWARAARARPRGRAPGPRGCFTRRAPPASSLVPPELEPGRHAALQNAGIDAAVRPPGARRCTRPSRGRRSSPPAPRRASRSAFSCRRSRC